jgi:hypothetical protein
LLPPSIDSPLRELATFTDSAAFTHRNSACESVTGAFAFTTTAIGSKFSEFATAGTRTAPDFDEGRTAPHALNCQIVVGAGLPEPLDEELRPVPSQMAADMRRNCYFLDL